ncbi:hypothetical protein DFH11DRAFT_1640982 [Phellopilus nigrolimitatus]|nr:hypothetical protein DFH11DRAFT_1640982 [Phellopilus nigrolimitatus]
MMTGSILISTWMRRLSFVNFLFFIPNCFYLTLLLFTGCSLSYHFFQSSCIYHQMSLSRLVPVRLPYDPASFPQLALNPIPSIGATYMLFFDI